MNAEKEKLQSCRLRVAPEIGSTICCGRILPQNATRNFHWFMFFALYLFVYWYIYILYIYYYVCIYIYILYII